MIQTNKEWICGFDASLNYKFQKYLDENDDKGLQHTIPLSGIGAKLL